MPAIDQQTLRQHLTRFDFPGLFAELGWNRYPGAPMPVVIETVSYRLQPIAEKAGLAVYVCTPGPTGAIPDSTARRAIEHRVAKLQREHLIIYVDRQQTTQVWQWVRREAGLPIASREQRFERGGTGEALLQRLRAVAFSLEEEERGITISDVTGRVRAAFDIEKVTKRFYDRFKAEHQAFLRFVQGIQTQGDREWYASLMLNRLMFIYFIQKKGFLDGDLNYLRTKLGQMQARAGKDTFLSFYRHFLLRLFHEGLNRPAPGRARELDALLGTVPYLNGGLFDMHQLEQQHKGIQIPDEAFERMFDFFDQYQWHLDERPLRRDNEINPDVLGYIFEKYINQKQMGAYYTKEDITGYIAQNTIIPHLFTAAEQDCPIAFRPDGALWHLLRDDPDRYIYPAVRTGVDAPLPADIAAGIDDVSKRGGWNRPADATVALPTETWRELVARRQRCLSLRTRLAAGEVCCIDDLITHNLDIRQFAQDAIAYCEGPELLRAFYGAITKVSVLDPTCGSGAFLFAALNILEPLYEACLERMQGFVEDADRSPRTAGRFQDFRATLKAVRGHLNRTYFILKSIILNNLYGVDIMEEAVGICKLRLFLKLAAQVEDADQIEPLPDIDFNIRAGNTLVGFANLEDARRVIEGGHQQRLLLDDRMASIKARLGEISARFQSFRDLQTVFGSDSHLLVGAKRDLRERLSTLSEELDRYLAVEYGIDRQATRDPREYEERFAAWRDSHQPFHWFVEFYDAMNESGFKAIVGNPPYVEYSKVRDAYSVINYESLTCGNLYALVVERSLRLSSRGGAVGMILPLSLVCTKRMSLVRRLVLQRMAWISSFDMRPSSLFDGVAQRLSIAILHQGDRHCAFTGGYRRWTADERPALIQTTGFVSILSLDSHSDYFPKLSLELEAEVLHKMIGPSLGTLVSKNDRPIYVHRIVRYFAKALDFIPLFVDAEGRKGKSEDYKEFRFSHQYQSFVCSLLNSSLFYWYWRAHADGFHCGYGDVYPLSVGSLPDVQAQEALGILHASLMFRMLETSRQKQISTKAGCITYQEFSPKLSKNILDSMDRILAGHYGFTDEELDFIVNYDIKYRMGQDTDGEGDGE